MRRIDWSLSLVIFLNFLLKVKIEVQKCVSYLDWAMLFTNCPESFRGCSPMRRTLWFWLLRLKSVLWIYFYLFWWRDRSRCDVFPIDCMLRIRFNWRMVHWDWTLLEWASWAYKKLKYNWTDYCCSLGRITIFYIFYFVFVLNLLFSRGSSNFWIFLWLFLFFLNN